MESTTASIYTEEEVNYQIEAHCQVDQCINANTYDKNQRKFQLENDGMDHEIQINYDDDG